MDNELSRELAIELLEEIENYVSDIGVIICTKEDEYERNLNSNPANIYGEAWYQLEDICTKFFLDNCIVDANEKESDFEL